MSGFISMCLLTHIQFKDVKFGWHFNKDLAFYMDLWKPKLLSYMETMGRAAPLKKPFHSQEDLALFTCLALTGPSLYPL